MSFNTISSLMTHDHRECDIHFEDIEKNIHEKNFEMAHALFSKWKTVNLGHFEIEETILFPETTKAMGVKLPPIIVMEMEHLQIKKCINDMEMALLTKNAEAFIGLADTCIIMIQQHNIKEEQILYPIIDRSVLTNNPGIVNEITEQLNARSS